MICADRYSRAADASKQINPDYANEAWLASVFHISGDGDRAHFVVPVDGGCVRIYLKHLGAKNVARIVYQLTRWMIEK